MAELEIMTGDALVTLRTLPAERYHTVVTSPPYWGLRDYGVDGQLGRERTPEEYVARMVEVFAEVRRVLRKDGTLWLNLGDCYGPGKQLLGLPWRVALALQQDGWLLRQEIIWHKANPLPESAQDRPTRSHEQVFLLARAPKYFYDQVAVREPSCEANAVRAQRQPVGLISTSAKGRHAQERVGAAGTGLRQRNYAADAERGRNLRSVWTIATQPYKESHFATFPPALVERSILAGTSARGCCATCGAPWVRQVERRFVPQQDVSEERGRRGAAGQKPLDASNRNDGYPRGTTEVTTTGWAPRCACGAVAVPCRVLDPFGGAGTTALVARRLGRAATLIELSPEYAQMARRRIEQDAPLLNKGCKP